MKKVRAAIVGYGNIGHFVLEALQAAPDFEIAGVVRRAGAENRPAELSEYSVVKDIKELKDVDVAILVLLRVALRNMLKKYWHLASIQWTASIFIPAFRHCAVHWMLRQKHIILFLLFLPVGIREAILLCVPCWRLLRRRELPIPTSVRV